MNASALMYVYMHMRMQQNHASPAKEGVSRQCRKSHSYALVVCVSVDAWLMFLLEQKFRSIFCSPGCIDNARIGCYKRFLLLVTILLLCLCQANSEIDICPYRCNPFYTAISRLITRPISNTTDIPWSLLH